MTVDIRERCQDMTDEEREQHVRLIHITHPDFKKTMALMRETHKQYGKPGAPECMLVYGPAGIGKTRLRQRYDEKIRQEHKTTVDGKVITMSNILSVEINSSSKPVRLAEQMLARLGDPSPTRGTIGDKEQRLFVLIETRKVEFMIFDESQHLVKATRKEFVPNEVADWFKTLVNQTGVPIVIFGNEDARYLMRNEQLNDRFPIQVSLTPFEIDSDLGRRTFERVLLEIDRQLPFPEPSVLDNSDMVEALYYACDGVMRRLMFLIRRAANYAITEGHGYIERADFAKAWNIYRKDKMNPFAEKR